MPALYHIISHYMISPILVVHQLIRGHPLGQVATMTSVLPPVAMAMSSSSTPPTHLARLAIAEASFIRTELAHGMEKIHP